MTFRIRASLLTTAFALFLVAGPIAMSQQPPAETDEAEAPLNLPGTHSANSDQLILSWPADNSQLRAFSFKHSLWSTLDIEPTESLKPVVVDDVAVVRIGDEVAAFSAVTGQWKRLKLRPESDPQISAKGQVAFVVDADHIYTFSATNGNWTSPTDPNYLQPLPTATAFRGAGQKFQGYPVPHRLSSASAADAARIFNTGVRRAEEASLQMAKQLRDQEKINDNDRSKLQQAVAQAFDERLAAQEAQLEPLRQKLKRIESTLQTRRENRSKIIEHRMNELLNPNIHWDQTTSWQTEQSPPVASVTAAGGLPTHPSRNSPIGLPGPPHLPMANGLSPAAGTPGSTSQAPRKTGDPQQWNQGISVLNELASRRVTAKTMAAELESLLARANAAGDRSGERKRLGPLIARLSDALTQSKEQWASEVDRLQSELSLLDLELRAAKLNQERASAEAARIAELSKRNLITAKDTMEGRVGAELAAIEVQKVQTRIDQLRKLLQRIQDLEPESVDVSQDDFENVATPEEAKN